MYLVATQNSYSLEKLVNHYCYFQAKGSKWSKFLLLKLFFCPNKWQFSCVKTFMENPEIATSNFVTSVNKMYAFLSLAGIFSRHASTVSNFKS